MRHSTAEERNDWFECSSYTTYVDQLLFYAQLRKGLGKKDSNSLNAIAREELGDEKLDYSDLGTIADFPYKDYKLFVKYNIKDVLLCSMIERKNGDMDLYYSLSMLTRTRLFKAMKKTISIKNLATKFFYDQGYYIGNNMNVDYGDKKHEDKEQFEGALVGDPNNNLPVGKKLLGELSSYIFDYVIDYDLSSLYPSIIRAFNIDITTQYGRLLINELPAFDDDRLLPELVNQIAEAEHERDLGGEFLEDYNTRDFDYIGRKWFALPNDEELIAHFSKFMKSENNK